MKSRRRGIIYISGCMIEKEPWLVRCVLSRGIVVRAEYLYEKDAVQYSFICDEFAEVPDCMITPEYTVLIDDVKGVSFEQSI